MSFRWLMALVGLAVVLVAAGCNKHASLADSPSTDPAFAHAPIHSIAIVPIVGLEDSRAAFKVTEEQMLYNQLADQLRAKNPGVRILGIEQTDPLFRNSQETRNAIGNCFIQHSLPDVETMAATAKLFGADAYLCGYLPQNQCTWSDDSFKMKDMEFVLCGKADKDSYKVLWVGGGKVQVEKASRESSPAYQAFTNAITETFARMPKAKRGE